MEVPVRASTITAIAMILLLAACSSPSRQRVSQGAADPDRVAPATAMAKRAPLQSGERASPVIAFRGDGEGWTMQIENTGDFAHRVDFSWSGGREHASGTLQYRLVDGADTVWPIVLDGMLDTQAGQKTMRVEIVPSACAFGDGDYTHAVHVAIQDLGPMRGCGDLAK